MKINFPYITGFYHPQNHDRYSDNPSYYKNNHIEKDASAIFHSHSNNSQAFRRDESGDAIIESVEVNEGERYLVSFACGFRQLATLIDGTNLLLKAQLETEDPWLIQQLATSLSARKILVIEPFQPKETVQQLEIELRIQSYNKIKGGTIQDDYPSMDTPKSLAECYIVHNPMNFGINNCMSLMTGLDGMGDWKQGEMVHIGNECDYVENHHYVDLQKIVATNSTHVFTKARSSFPALLAKVISEPGSPEISLLTDVSNKPETITPDRELESLLFETKRELLISDNQSIDRFKSEIIVLINNHGLINDMNQLQESTSNILDFDNSDKDVNDTANQQKAAIITFLESTKDPLKKMQYNSGYLSFIRKHTLENQQEPTIDQIIATQQSLIEEFIAAGNALATCGFINFDDIPAFFKTPTMDMNIKENFRHKTRSDAEAELFANLAELAVYTIAEIENVTSYTIAEIEKVTSTASDNDCQEIPTEIPGLILD